MQSLELIKSLSLVALLLAFSYVGFVWFLRQKNKLPLGHLKKHLRVIEYLPIDQKNSLCLIKAGKQHFVIAMNAHNLQIHHVDGVEHDSAQ